MRRASKWFLVVIILCVALLAAMRLRQHGDLNPVARTKMHLLQISQASKFYHIAYGLWPTGVAELYPEHNSNHVAFLPPGPWTTNDGWRHALLYSPFNPALGYGAVVSMGRDGKSGGIGEDADIEDRFQ